AGRIRVPVDNAASTGQVQVRWAQRIPSGSLPSSTVVLARVEFSTGTIGHAELRVRDSDGAWGLFGFDTDGDQISGSTYSTGTDWRGRQMRMSLEFDQSGSN